MTATGQGRRRYDVTRRRAQAAENRERVLEVARRLFVEQGFAGTSIAQIAAAAGVSAPTVFAGFGSKVNLLKEAVDTAIVGDTAAVPLADRPAFQRIVDSRTAEDVVRRYAELSAEVSARAGPIAAVVYAAADSDPQLADLARTYDQQRLAGCTTIAKLVADRLGTSDPDRLEYLRDTVWALFSWQLYALLVIQRGWSVERYADWIVRAFSGIAA
jgi:AcrR family transcriptional regulator